MNQGYRSALRHFLEELDELQSRLLEMGTLVESAIHRSVVCLVERDEAAAQEVLHGETRVNKMQIENDDEALRLLALHQPMARDLRFLTAGMKINTDLERMGDLAVNIVERALSLMKQPPIEPRIDIPRMARLAESMVHRSLAAFVNRDGELAHAVLLSDDAVDDLRDAIYQELIAFMEREPATISRGLDLLLVARNLERIADHATNIAEDALFLAEGVDVRHHAEARSHLG
jgi:phosphate transport system protein